MVQIFEKTALWKSDELIGEVVVDIGFLANNNSKPDERDHPLSKEPKKKAGPGGTLKLKLFYPMPEVAASGGSANPAKKRCVTDVYSIGDELGR